MFAPFQFPESFGKDSVERTSRSIAAVAQEMQDLVADAADYSRSSFTASTRALERLLGASSVEKALEIQAAFAKTSYEGFITHTTRVGEAMTNIARESVKPFEGLLGHTARS